MEIAFVAYEPEITMLRTGGDVEFVEDESEKNRLLQERPWLLQYGKEGDDDLLSIFRIVRGKENSGRIPQICAKERFRRSFFNLLN